MLLLLLMLIKYTHPTPFATYLSINKTGGLRPVSGG
jgi:hypothetical protein